MSRPDPLAALAHLSPEDQLAAATRRLSGARPGPLARHATASELAPVAGRIDGRLLEAIAARALDGARGAVFTPAAEARILAAFGLAHLAARRGGPAAGRAVELLLSGGRDARLARALDGARVLDPACGGGALLASAERLARGAGARLALHGIDLAPLAAEAARARLALLGAAAEIACADALAGAWPRADLVLANPPFLRHEAVPAAEKAGAARASGLSRQADLSAHFAAVSVRRAPLAALVWPRALLTSRSAAPLLADARARGGFVLRLRSRAAGSFAASVDTLLVVWAEGATDLPAADARVPLADLSGAELARLAAGGASARLVLARAPAPVARGSLRVADVCDVRFGTKTGCNAFFHLRATGPGLFASELAGEVRLDGGDVVPLLATLKEARAPELAAPTRVLFRPARTEPIGAPTGTPGPRRGSGVARAGDPAAAPAPPSAAARRYVARGEAEGVHLRPTCAGRSPWWRLAPGRGPAPVLYPAKIGTRAFAFLNEARLWEDKKWHALFPRAGAVPAWQLALVLCATPVRLAIDEGARQLTGAQAIADVDCRVVAAAPFPPPAALAALAAPLARLRAALARDPVTTDLDAMLARDAQRELDELVARALGLGPAGAARARRALRERVLARAAHGAAVKAALRAPARDPCDDDA